MAGDDDIPLGGFQVPNGRKARTFSREDSATGRGEADNDFGPLELDTGPERLPWLEADDDAYELERPDNGRVLGFALLGLVGLIALIGGIWWATHRQSSDKLVADGSTVAAPSQPYKILPTEPGGKTFDGTGDSAFVVSEGQSRPAKLGETGAAMPSAVTSGAAAPSVDIASKPAATTPLAASKPSWPTPVESIKPLAPAAKTPAAAAARTPVAPVATPVAAAVSRGPVVQVGAYSTRAAAEAGWGKLMGRSAALSGQRHQIVEGQADFGRVFRLQVISGDSGSANALCGKLKGSGIACQVKN